MLDLSKIDCIWVDYEKTQSKEDLVTFKGHFEKETTITVKGKPKFHYEDKVLVKITFERPLEVISMEE